MSRLGECKRLISMRIRVGAVLDEEKNRSKERTRAKSRPHAGDTFERTAIHQARCNAMGKERFRKEKKM